MPEKCMLVRVEEPARPPKIARMLELPLGGCGLVTSVAGERHRGNDQAVSKVKNLAYSQL
jgi:hypothetical protein